MFKIILLGNFCKEILEPLELFKDDFKIIVKNSGKNLQSSITKHCPDAVFYKIGRITEFSEKNIKKILNHKHNPLLYVIGQNFSVKWIIENIKNGVCDYIDLQNFEKNTMELLRKSMSHKMKKQRTSLHPALDAIIGNTREIQELKQKALKYARCNETLLITGETGTGKGLLAEVIHKIQFGENSPFIGRNCGAIPDMLFESILFGTSKGSFTDSIDKPGFFEQANNGTLFLDEIGEISPHLQVKILQAVEEKKILRLGHQIKTPVNIRLISATNKNLGKAVKKGQFRSDLYYRLNTLKLHIPPLRKRKDDIFQISQYILQSKGSQKRLTDSAMDKILSHNWPGNVRELITTLKRADILSSEEEILKPEHILIDE